MVNEKDRCKVKCSYCGVIFESRSPNRKSCDEKECRLKALHERTSALNIYRKKYANSDKGKIAFKNLPSKRKKRRRELGREWGTNGRLIWKDAENIDLVKTILEKEGFINIKNLNEYHLNFPFDYYAEQGIQKFVFQITVRTHSKKTKQVSLAKLFGMEHLTLFIKQDLKYYILKSGSTPEIGEQDIENLKEVQYENCAN